MWNDIQQDRDHICRYIHLMQKDLGQGPEVSPSSQKNMATKGHCHAHFIIVRQETSTFTGS